MLKPLDLYAYEETKAFTSFGTATIKYELRKYRDVRNLGSAPAYMLVCTQRIVVPGASAYMGGPISTTNYLNYPAIIVNQIIPQVNINNATAVVKTMFPRTLNTAVSTSVNSQNAGTNTSEYQYTSGSTTSTANTFSVSQSIGAFGIIPTGGISLDYQRGWGHETSSSSTNGQTSSQESSTSSGDAMSIKDWSSYGYLTGNTITWLWGQTYPWDVLQYNQSPKSDGTVTLPSFVQSRLLDGSLVLPPSALSLYGCDFTMKAGWLIEFPDGINCSETIQLTHNMICYYASHSLNGSQILATLKKSSQTPPSYTSPALDMSTYALDPITTPTLKNGAAIGFTTSNFTYAPTNGNAFKITSPANNLQVTGSGFDAAGITTTFQQSLTPSLTIQFKVIDSAYEYALLLKHWIGPSSNACKMTFTINNQNVTLYVDATEGQGGQNNLSVIELRNTDLLSIDFHDYLVIGLNTITVAIEPVVQASSNQYTLFSLAIRQV